MPRIYVPAAYFKQFEFSLPEAAARHVQVLRQQPGEHIELTDGLGMVYGAEITAMGKKNVDVRVTEQRAVSVETPLSVTLLQSVSAAERMALTIQKSVELGIAAIQPVLTERSSQRLAGERAATKVARWQDIAISACEQCGRTFIPVVHPLLPLPAALAALPAATTRLLMSLHRPLALKHLSPPGAVTLLIGPEGGLSAAEEALAIQQHGFQPVSLGPRILRTETAGLAALAAIQTLWGDF